MRSAMLFARSSVSPAILVHARRPGQGIPRLGIAAESGRRRRSCPGRGARQDAAGLVAAFDEPLDILLDISGDGSVRQELARLPLVLKEASDLLGISSITCCSSLAMTCAPDGLIRLRSRFSSPGSVV